MQTHSPKIFGLCRILTIQTLAVLATCSATPTTAASGGGWQHNFEEAATAARNSGKPLLVHFYADWCGPCRQMDAQTLGQPAVTAMISRTAVGVKINADHRPDLVAKYSISSLPTDVLVSTQGQIIARNSGFLSAQQYVASLGSAARRAPKQQQAAPQPHTQPRDTELANRDTKPSPRENRNSAGSETPRPNKQAAPSTSSPNSAAAPIMIVSRQPPMLRGYSPVALQTNREWKMGRPEFAVEYRGQIYRLSSAEEKAQFLANPRNFTPRLMGCDAIVFSQFDRAIPGKLEYAAFFGDELYLFHSDENRVRFRATPQKFVSTRVVNLTDIEAVIR